MKTSNKLLLGFVLLSFGTFLAVHGALYGKYRNGEFVGTEQLRSEEFIRYPIAKPRVISFDGTVWVNLIPADSFALELPRVNKDPDEGMFDDGPKVRVKEIGSGDNALVYEQKNDTLFVRGNTKVTIHRPWAAHYYRRGVPIVNLYAPSFDKILLNNGQLCLRGMAPFGKAPTHLTVSNSTLWIGMQYENVRRDLTESFDSLDIGCTNSIVVLNSAANINYLSAQLKDSSVITDQYSILKNATITTSPDSRVDISGSNLKNSRIITQ
jgi:hypothetical protein